MRCLFGKGLKVMKNIVDDFRKSPMKWAKIRKVSSGRQKH